MKNRKNYYQILHVQNDAPEEVIRSCYRTMMQKLKMHPDLGGDQEDAALINQAYAVLINPSARAKYDAILSRVNTTSENKSGGNQKQTQKPNRPAPSLNLNNYKENCLFCFTLHKLGKTIKPESFCVNCKSPLFPAKKQRLEKRDQRSILRIGKQWPIKLYTQWPQSTPHSVETQDISLNGMQILTTMRMYEGQIVKISGESLDSVARVVNQQFQLKDDINYWRVGLEYITLYIHSNYGTFLCIDI